MKKKVVLPDENARSSWIMRLFVVGIGLVLMLIGFGLYFQGIYWYRMKPLNTYYSGDRPTLGLGLFGLMFFLAGALPWDDLLRWWNKPDRRKD